MTDQPSDTGASPPRTMDAQYFVNGAANRAKAAEYFLAQFVTHRLDGATDCIQVQEILDTIFAKASGLPAETWIAGQGMSMEYPEKTAEPTPPPAIIPGDDTPPPAPAAETAVPEQESPPPPPAPSPVDDVTVAETTGQLLSTMDTDEAIHAETTLIYDLCKQRDDLQEQCDALQAQINAGHAAGDAAATLENLQKQFKGKEAEIQQHRAIRMHLQEQQARGK